MEPKYFGAESQLTPSVPLPATPSPNPSGPPRVRPQLHRPRPLVRPSGRVGWRVTEARGPGIG